MKSHQAARIVLALIALLALNAEWALAQRDIDLSDITLCERCTLSATVIARLGETEGEGIIESYAAQVRFDPRTRNYALFHVGGSRLLLFDSLGRFVRSVGRGGPGPGELGGIVDAQLSRSRIVVLDRAGPSLLTMTPTGDVISEARLALRRGRFRVVSDSTVVVAAMDRSPAAAGYPLHLVDLHSGVPSRHFGSKDGQWSVTDRYASNPLIGISNGATVWEGTGVPFLFEEWSLNGDLQRTVTARGRWFAAEASKEADGAPPTVLETFGIDDQDRLWTITLVPDPRWHDAPRAGREGYVAAQDFGRFFDARIDVYDLRQRRHLGTLRWDEAYAGLVQIGGEVAVQRVEEDAQSAQVVVYRLAPSRRP